MKNRSAMGNRPYLPGGEYFAFKPPIWKIDELPALETWDGLAFKAEPGLEEWAIHLEQAESWHWAGAGLPLPADQYGPADREIVGSIDKGVATELLSAYQWRHMRIYRPEMMPEHPRPAPEDVKKRCANYGAYRYNLLGVNEAAVSYLLRYLGIKVHLTVTHGFYCLQFYNRILADFSFVHYDPDYPVTPYDMENLPGLKCIWGTY